MHRRTLATWKAVGGARFLYCWGAYVGDASIRRQALQLLDHVLKVRYLTTNQSPAILSRVPVRLFAF